MNNKLNPFSVILLAAGKGKRMHSALPKVMHPVAGQPMIKRVIQSYKILAPKEIRVVLGHGKDLIAPLVEQLGAQVFIQDKQLGTGHAVMCAQPSNLDGTIVIANGDHPAIDSAELSKLISEHQNSDRDLTVVSCLLKKPAQYGRIVRQSGRLKAIVEAKDASKETLKINEINTGIYIIQAELLSELIKDLSQSNAQGEYYLTEIVEKALKAGKIVDAKVGSSTLAMGVNSQLELAKVTKFLFNKKAKDLLEAGVIILDPLRVYIETTAQVAEGAVIYPDVFIKGESKIGSRCVIGPNSWIQDSRLAEDVVVKAGSYIEDSEISSGTSVGPYAHLRPKSKIGKNCKIGNFVETKNVNLADGVKASHLTYLGDADIGAETNIGCGTITCNYAADHNKYRTEIGANVFVGSDTQFVAPVKIGDNAVIGSGSTITKNVPANALAVARGKQFIKEDYRK